MSAQCARQLTWEDGHMGIDVTKTGGGRAEITWDPREDDPRGRLAQVVESDRLADALTALGASTVEGLGDDVPRVLRHTQALVRDLERKVRGMAVEMRRQGASWPVLAAALYDDPAKTSSARRVYDAGMRQLGLAAAPFDATETTTQD
jgi:hypothetical protein